MRQSLSAALCARLGGRLAAAPGNIYVTRPVCPARPRPAPRAPAAATPRPAALPSAAPLRAPAPAGSQPGTPTPAWLLLRAPSVARSSHSFPGPRRLPTWPDLNPLPLTKSKPHLAMRPPPHAQVCRVKALMPSRPLSVGVRWTWSGPGCTRRQSSSPTPTPTPGLEFRILVPILSWSQPSASEGPVLSLSGPEPSRDADFSALERRWAPCPPWWPPRLLSSATPP